MSNGAKVLNENREPCVCLLYWEFYYFYQQPNFLQTVLVHKRKTRCQLMLHNSNTVGIIYKNTYILKAYELSFQTKPSLVQSDESVLPHYVKWRTRISWLIFDCTAGKWLKQKNSKLISFRITSLLPILSYFFSLRMDWWNYLPVHVTSQHSLLDFIKSLDSHITSDGHQFWCSSSLLFSLVSIYPSPTFFFFAFL